MYDIRQFRPALYTLLILGMSGFALAAQSPGIWVLAVGAILFNGWLIKIGYFRPLPRLFANLITLLALLYIVYEVMFSGITPIMVIGQFLVILQLDRKSTRLNSSHGYISYAVFCLKKKKKI